MPEKNITYELVEFIGTISTHNGWAKEINLISWNGGPPKYDIRDWNHKTEQMSRGITLHESELRRAIKLFYDSKNNKKLEEGLAREAETRRRREEHRRRQQEAREREEAREARKKAAEDDAIEGATPPKDEPEQLPFSEEQDERSFDAMGLDAGPLVDSDDDAVQEPEVDAEFDENDETEAEQNADTDAGGGTKYAICENVYDDSF